MSDLFKISEKILRLLTQHSAVILLFLVNLAVMVSPLVTAQSHWTFVTGYISFTNIMACRVFRMVALGMLDVSRDQVGLSTTRIAAAFENLPSLAV